MIKVSTTGMVVSLKTDLRFPIPGQQGHGGRIIHLGRDRFRFISPYTTARLDKRQKIFFHTDIVLHSANTSEIQATKKPHNYHKIAVWQKDDRIRKSPLKFCVYYYSELEGDCQASIITELWRLSVGFYVTLWHMRNSVWFCTRSEWACSPIGRPPTIPIHSVHIE